MIPSENSLGLSELIQLPGGEKERKEMKERVWMRGGWKNDKIIIDIQSQNKKYKMYLFSKMYGS